jgi:hypothetical protein
LEQQDKHNTEKEHPTMSEATSTTPAPSAPKVRTVSANNSGNAVYGLGIIGAAIYFIQHATSFGSGVLGLFEALVWPVFVVYKLLEFLHL